MKRIKLSPTMLFALPVIVENILMIAATQISSGLIGQISRSSLAAVGTVNVVNSFLTAAFTLINTGGVVLIAREIGARSRAEASETIEQSAGFILVAGLVVMAVLFAGAGAIMRLLMPTAEEALMDEAVAYLRVIALSFPPMMLSTLLCGAMRAAGATRPAMGVGVGMNVVQVLAMWALVSGARLGLVGAGLSYVVGRLSGAAAALVIISRMKDRCDVRPLRMLRPKLGVWRRVARVGAPTSFEQIAVQGGYVLANSMVVGLGTLNATVYQVCNTVGNFNSLPSSVCTATTLAMVGQKLGERKEDEAQRLTWHVWAAGVASVLSIGLVTAVFGRTMAGLYTSDPVVVDMSRPILWLLMANAVPALSINVIDPALKAGGDGRYVLMVSMLGVWLVRLPLTWLLAYRLDMGVMGVFLANYINLLFRAALGIARFVSRKWIHVEI